MKDVMEALNELFTKHYGLTVLEFNLKLTTRGQVEVLTGVLDYTLSDNQIIAVEKEFRKTLAAENYRFLNCLISITGYKFSILKR